MIMSFVDSHKLGSKIPTMFKQKSQHVTANDHAMLNSHPNLYSLPQRHNQLQLQKVQKSNKPKQVFNTKHKNKSLSKHKNKLSTSYQSNSKNIRQSTKISLHQKSKVQQTSICSLNQQRENQQVTRFASNKMGNPENYEVQFRLREEISKFKCPICLQEQSISKRIEFDDCLHIFCESCIQEQIRFLIKSNRLIKCLQATCQKTIGKKSALYSRMTSAQQKQYRRILKSQHQKADSRCPCCRALITVGQSECGKCGVSICPVCMELRHEGDCNANFESISYQQIRATYNLLRCNRCKTYIQKEGGCSHITCVCGHYFCELCGETLTENHLCLKIKRLSRSRPIRQNQTKPTSVGDQLDNKQQSLIVSSRQPVVQVQPPREDNTGELQVCQVIRNRPVLSLLLFLTIPCDIIGFLILLLAYVAGFCVVIVVSLFYDTMKELIQTYEGNDGWKCIGWTMIIASGLPLVFMIIVYWPICIINRTGESLIPLMNPYLQRIRQLPVTKLALKLF